MASKPKPPPTRRKGVKPKRAAGLGHIWLPYTQMKTANPPLEVARTQGARIMLDGYASDKTGVCEFASCTVAVQRFNKSSRIDV